MVYDCPQRRELSVWAEVGEAVLLNLQQHKHTFAYDLETPLKGFRSQSIVDLECSN